MKPNNEARAPYRSPEIWEAGVARVARVQDWPRKHGIPKDAEGGEGAGGGVCLLLSIRSRTTCDHLRGKSDLAKCFDRTRGCNYCISANLGVVLQDFVAKEIKIQRRMPPCDILNF